MKEGWMRWGTLTGVLLLVLNGSATQAADLPFDAFNTEYSRAFARLNGSATFQPKHCSNSTICRQQLGADIIMITEMASRSGNIGTVTLVAPADGRRVTLRFLAAVTTVMTLLSPTLNDQDRSAMLQSMGNDFDVAGKARLERGNALYKLESVPDQHVSFSATLKLD